MPDQIAHLRDKDGIVHHMSRYSKVAVDGLADGSFVDVEEEPHAPADAADSDDHDAGEPDEGPGDGQPEAGEPDDEVQSSLAKPKARR